MKEKTICLCAVLFMAAIVSPAQAWKQLHCCVDPSYGLSHWEVAQIPVWGNTNNLPSGVTPTQFETALKNAINTWNGAGANISFVYKGTFGTEACSPSGFIDCSDPTSPCKPTYADVVGFTTNLLLDQVLAFEPGVEISIEPTLGQEFDTCVHSSGKTLAYSVALNQQASFSTYPAPTQIDLQSVILHELGHVLGLGHSSDPSAVMYEYMKPGLEGIKRTLRLDDKIGIRSIYGVTAPTLTHWGLIILTILVISSGIWFMLRKRRAVRA